MQNENLNKYYLGLDVGTDSVGYAVTNADYSLKKHSGEPMWGVHLFDEASLSAERRAFRTARRRLDRRQQRVLLIQELFAKEISKVDKDFYIRIAESRLTGDDTEREKGLFADKDFNDKDYYLKYPTIHHLIMELINDPSYHDPRLVYICCAWLVAHRGHFLSDISADNITDLTDVRIVYDELMDFFEDVKPWEGVDAEEVCRALELGKNVTAKKKELTNILYGGKLPAEIDGLPYSPKGMVTLLSGGVCKAKDLFADEWDDPELSISLNVDDAKWEELLGLLGDDGELLKRMKNVIDCVALKKLLGGDRYISNCKIRSYDVHKADLAYLKSFIKKYVPEKYKDVFVKPSKDNYVGYSKNERSLKGERLPGTSNAESFCKYIKGIVGKVKVEPEDSLSYNDMLERLDNLSFMPKQVTGDNRLLPYQLYLVELRAILANARKYLPFLNEKDNDGIDVCQKIESVFKFRVPYYVGPLNRSNSLNAWIERKAEGRILPWNFEDKVDLNASEAEFIRRMTNKCTYLPDQDVLPKASLLYQKYEVLNEINNIRIDGVSLTPEQKQLIYKELFVKSKKKLTKKKVKEALVSLCIMSADMDISGIDDNVNSSLSSYHAFKRLLESETLTEPDVERIILQSTVTFDRSRFKNWLREHYPHISEQDVRYIASVKCKDFGRLSEAFLNGGIVTVDNATGEVHSIMDMLWNTNNNLMQLLSDRFGFASELDRIQKEYYSVNDISLNDRLDKMYVSNTVRRQIIRTLDVVKDVVKANKGVAPEKIFVEMARGGDKNKKKTRTKSRHDQIIELYKSKELDTRELLAQLEQMGEDVNNRLQSDKLFLYFLQLGKSAYSDKHIDISQLGDDSVTNIDHIWPRSKVADDSVINNKVLCLSEENGAKGDRYPVDAEIRSKMQGFWATLRKNGLMSEEKYKRLTRSTPFTEEEKRNFINRQIVETRQSTKILASLFKEMFPESEIVYVKAGLVSEFRQEYDFVKSRAINDLHHAKDAYLNIVVGNVYHTKYTEKFFLKHMDDYSLNIYTTFGNYFPVSGRWQGTEYFTSRSAEIVRKTMLKNNIHQTVYSYCTSGGFFDQMPVKAKEGLVPLKKGLPTELYGGYNKPSASFYTLAKFKSGKKDELMLVPVELLSAGCFDDMDSALEYTAKAIEKIKGTAPKDLSLPLGMRKIKIKTMFELDGFRVCLNGKSSGGSAVITSPLNALVLSYTWEKYVKKLESFAKKHAENPKIQYNKERDGIDAERNVELYEVLVAKAEGFFSKTPGLQIDKIVKSLNEFLKLDIYSQTACLLSMVSLFARTADTGKTTIDLGSGKCILNACLSNWTKKYSDVRIVDSSASGIYETKSQNLLELLK